MKVQALEKMLEEMKHDHTSAEDKIHNWLCGQEDEKLFEGILQEGKSISASMKYCIQQAAKMKGKESSLMVDDETVFGWVKDYFLSKETVIKSVPSAKVAVSQTVTKPKENKRKVKAADDMQLSLF